MILFVSVINYVLYFIYSFIYIYMHVTIRKILLHVACITSIISVLIIYVSTSVTEIAIYIYGKDILVFRKYHFDPPCRNSLYISSLFPYSKKINVGLWDVLAEYVSVYPPLSTFNVSTNIYETWCVYRDTWVHPNGVHHIHFPSILRLYMYFPIVARQRLGKNITTTVDTHATIELEASFSFGHVVSKESRLLVLHITSCLQFLSILLHTDIPEYSLMLRK
jgi:hypothetical protein